VRNALLVVFASSASQITTSQALEPASLAQPLAIHALDQMPVLAANLNFSILKMECATNAKLPAKLAIAPHHV